MAKPIEDIVYVLRRSLLENLVNAGRWIDTACHEMYKAFNLIFEQELVPETLEIL